ncbi:hypothetical protein BJ958_005400 [Nocardioides kongjuensis]|uniref:Terminase n=2 Tax=Nocardioides kongjuensis TaxID=349522 RepID=A0A852S165_9ACTN|nr:hypothetical protein [Nocardioides kongjuensis]
MAKASALVGRPFMPHQREIVDVFLEVQSEEAGDPEPGEWAYDDGTGTLERRAGKTAIQSPLVTHRAELIDRARMFMAAHKGDITRRRWLDITEDILSSPLRDQVTRKVSISHEELRWKRNNSTLIPFAANEDAMHSETPHLVLIDELWAFSEEQKRVVEAGYVPAFATSSGQALKMSTQGTERSYWLNAETKAGRRAVERGVRLGKFYYEHSLPDRVGGVLLKDLDDDALVQACIENHPAVCHRPGCPGPRQGRPCAHGFTVRPAAIRSAWSTMTQGDPALGRLEFLRAYGNRSAADLSGAWLAIDEAVWTRQHDTVGIPEGAPVALGVWVDEDGQDAALSAAFRGPDGPMRVEIPQTPVTQGDGASRLEPTVREGLRWIAGVVRHIAATSTVRTVAVANTKAARDVADELDAVDGLHVTRVSQADLPAACSRHRTALEDGSWFHRVSVEATEAAKAADWQRHQWARPGESISALGAQTLAGWGFDHAPEPEETYGRFVIG